METVTKKEIVASIQNRLAIAYPTISRQAVNDVIEEWVEEVQRTLSTGRRIELRGFGVFAPKERKERKARNPKTGEAIMVPARKTVVFQPGKDFKVRLQKQ